MEDVDEERSSPYLVLLMLVGKAFPGVDGKALGDKLAAPAVPPLVSAFFLGKNGTAGRTEELGGFVCIGVVHALFYHILFCRRQETPEGTDIA